MIEWLVTFFQRNPEQWHPHPWRAFTMRRRIDGCWHIRPMTESEVNDHSGKLWIW